MDTAKIFTNGRSQALRLPKEYRFTENEVYIKKIGGMVIIVPKEDPWASIMESLELFTPDFLAQRHQPAQNQRESME